MELKIVKGAYNDLYNNPLQKLSHKIYEDINEKFKGTGKQCKNSTKKFKKVDYEISNLLVSTLDGLNKNNINLTEQTTKNIQEILFEKRLEIQMKNKLNDFPYLARYLAKDLNKDKKSVLTNEEIKQYYNLIKNN